ncbi:hypothetical protein J1614_006219, partial [Plenodomus biglobosus]
QRCVIDILSQQHRPAQVSLSRNPSALATSRRKRTTTMRLATRRAIRGHARTHADSLRAPRPAQPSQCSRESPWTVDCDFLRAHRSATSPPAIAVTLTLTLIITITITITVTITVTVTTTALVATPRSTPSPTLRLASRMSRTLYPLIRSDTGYNNMQQQQPGAQVSGAGASMSTPTLLTCPLPAPTQVRRITNMQHQGLREHLLAAGAGQPTVQPLAQPLAQHPQQQQQQQQQHPHTTGPPHAIDPAIAGAAYAMSAADDGNTSEGRSKGRRELSTSKRAAQNRAAQRAFRQRKEEYIKQLKDQVKEFEQLCELYKTLQTENYQLRDYIINLQSRLLETQGEIPPAPAGVDLNRPHGEHSSLHQPQPQPPQHIQPPEPPQQQQQQQQQQQSSPSSNNGGLSERQIGELQMAAQAAAAAQHGTAGSKHPSSEGTYDYATAEKRQKTEESPQGQFPSPPYVSQPRHLYERSSRFKT